MIPSHVRSPYARITLLLALVLTAIPAARADEKELKNRIDRLEQELKIRDGLIRNLLDRLNVLEDAQSTRTKPPQASPATQSAPQPDQPASGAQTTRPTTRRRTGSSASWTARRKPAPIRAGPPNCTG